MNEQMRFSPTVEERLAGAVMRVLRHFANLYGREKVMDHIDHRDFASVIIRELRPTIAHELLMAKLEGLQIANVLEREREKNRVMDELSKP
jgi:hypothetical protein